MSEEIKYDKHYSEDKFWLKLKKHAVEAGLKVVYCGLILYYALQNPKTSLKDKVIIYGALGYLILPTDLIPDFILAIGYGDDLGVLLFAAARVAVNIDESVKQKAKEKLVDFFGKVALNQDGIKEVNKQIENSRE